MNRENTRPSPVDPALVAELKGLLAKATPGEWTDSWKTDYLPDGWRAMQGCGPQTTALKPDHPRFNELVAEQAFADAALISAMKNALPALLEALSTNTYAAGVEAGASYVEAQAKSAQDMHDLISVQSDLPISEPVFSCAGLLQIADNIRALTGCTEGE